MTAVIRRIVPSDNAEDDDSAEDTQSEGQDQRDDKDTSRSEKSKQDKDKAGTQVKSRYIIAEEINVGVPHDVAFAQWTQYDKWSEMFKHEWAKSGDEEDKDQKDQDDKDQDDGDEDDKHQGRNGHRAQSADRNGSESDDDDDDQPKVTAGSKIGPSRRQWDTQIMEQTPGRRIAWRATGGVQAKGVTTFHRLDDRLTQLMVEVEYRPKGFMETIGNFFRMQRRRVRKDLKLYKNYIELRGEATGESPGRVRGEGLRDDVDRQAGHDKED